VIQEIIAALSETLPAATAVTTGGALPTVTQTAAEVELLPAASHAMAVRACGPFALRVVSQEKEYGFPVVAEPRFPPSSLNWTCAKLAPLRGAAAIVT
jgi:hypothetical protein